MSTKEQIVQKLEFLSERNLIRLLQFASGLSQNSDNLKRETENNKGKVIIQGIDFTRNYSKCLLDPINKHFPKAAAVATVPLFKTASKCMEKGMDLFIDIAKGKAVIDDNELEKIADIFYTDEDDLIKSFPKTYFTRYKKILRSFILDAIIAGIQFKYEVATALDERLKPEVNSILTSYNRIQERGFHSEEPILSV